MPIINKTTTYFNTFLFLEECRGFGLVVDLEVCPDRYNKGDNPLEDLKRGRRRRGVSLARVCERPRRTKIQLHPKRPAFPLISFTPLAISPPNAPAAVAAEKKIALWSWIVSTGGVDGERWLTFEDHIPVDDTKY